MKKGDESCSSDFMRSIMAFKRKFIGLGDNLDVLLISRLIVELQETQLFEASMLYSGSIVVDCDPLEREVGDGQIDEVGY